MIGCPGQDLRFRTVDNVIYYVNCSNCGYSVEFFFDDRKRICNKCGEHVQPDLETLKKYQNCASSCKSARECLGEEKYQQLILTEPRTIQKGEEDLEKLLSLIPNNEEEVTAYFANTIRPNLQVGFLLNPETDIETQKEKSPKLYNKVKFYINVFCNSIEREHISGGPTINK